MTFSSGNDDLPPPWPPFIPTFDPPGSRLTFLPSRIPLKAQAPMTTHPPTTSIPTGGPRIGRGRLSQKARPKYSFHRRATSGRDFRPITLPFASGFLVARQHAARVFKPLRDCQLILNLSDGTECHVEETQEVCVRVPRTPFDDVGCD